MSIRVKRFVDLNEVPFFTLMNPDCEKGFTMYEACKIDNIENDFQGRVEDEISH